MGGHLISEECTLFEVTMKLLLVNGLHDLSQMLPVLLFILAINQDVIKVYHHKPSNEWPKYLIYEHHKSDWSIRQSEWHD